MRGRDAKSDTLHRERLKPCHPVRQAADDSAMPTYSQLLFPQHTSGVVHGDGQQVVYAVPQTR